MKILKTLPDLVTGRYFFNYKFGIMKMEVKFIQNMYLQGWI